MKGIVVLFDLDGVLAARDIAFDLFRAHGFGDYFKGASSKIAAAVNTDGNFNGQKAYAGQTVKFVMDEALKAGVKISNAEIEALASKARLMKGSKRLVSALKKSGNVRDVFIISTAYKPAADVMAKRLGISQKNVFATNLEIRNGSVVGTLGPACGGIHKAVVVDRISRATNTPLGKMVAVGDSITDIGMVDKVVKGGGLGIAFNANNDLLMRKPNVIYAGRSLRPVYGLVKAFALHGHGGVKRIVDRNIMLRRFVGVPMSLIGRPFLFRPGVKGEKAAGKSGLYRAKARSKNIARLR